MNILISLLNITLKMNVKIVETRKCYHPEFPTKPIGEKLAIFQNMWVPDQDSFNFFSCMHEHLKQNSTQCNNFCGQFSSPNCGRLATFLSTNNWPTPQLKLGYLKLHLRVSPSSISKGVFPLLSYRNIVIFTVRKSCNGCSVSQQMKWNEKVSSRLRS